MAERKLFFGTLKKYAIPLLLGGVVGGAAGDTGYIIGRLDSSNRIEQQIGRDLLIDIEKCEKTGGKLEVSRVKTPYKNAVALFTACIPSEKPQKKDPAPPHI